MSAAAALIDRKLSSDNLARLISILGFFVASTGLLSIIPSDKAIRDAKGHEINTGALNEFTSRFNRVTAAHEMVANHAGKVGTMIGAKGGPLGAVAGAALGEKLAQRARVAGGAGSADAAEQLIMSPAYQSAVKTLPKSAPAHVAETRIRRNPKWRAFYDSLPDKDKRTIARVGLAAWLRDMEETVNPPE